MALHRLLGMTIGVPEPDVLAATYAHIGLVGEGATWGTDTVGEQIAIAERPYRQLLQLRVGCETDADLGELRGRLEGLGIAFTGDDTSVTCTDPSDTWEVVVELAGPEELTGGPERAMNAPADRARPMARADVVVEAGPRPPRRLAHVVLGTPDTDEAAAFFLDGLGFRLSDSVAGMLHFMRCSSDHHNLLVQPGPVPYLNHYAFEFDDIDGVGAAARHYLDGATDRHVVGLGRHVIGSNVFWYVNDPCGTMMEFFCDMDDIPRDEEWEPRTDWTLETFSSWGPVEPPLEFAFPPDLDDIAAARAAEGR